MSELVAQLKSLLEEASKEWNRLEKFAKYHRGEHDDPYTPKQITPEFRALKKRSTTNLLPLVTATLIERLYIDGYRPDVAEDEGPEDAPVSNSPAWDWWQHNGMDARQKQIFEAVSKYGYSYVQVWAGESADGDPIPVFAPRSPRSWYARFDYPDDDWPVAAVRSTGRRAWMLTDTELHTFERDQHDRWEHASSTGHGFGVVPLVRFLNSWPDEDRAPVGEVEPLIDIQDRLNQSVFDLLVAQSYQGAPQQYIAGVVADTSEVVKAIAKRVWTFDEPTTQVGQLPPANLDNLIGAIENCLRIYGLKSQTPPHYLLGEMINIAADALAAAEASLSAKVADRQTLLGESAERMFRLGAVVVGDAQAAADDSSQAVWRPTDPRSLGATVDALGKIVAQLKVPADETWPMIPGVTQQTAARWRRKVLEGDPFAQLEEELDRQAASLGLD